VLGGGLFHYVDTATTKTFAGPQIRVVSDPDLGTLVSVTLHTSPIATTSFTVLLPIVNLDATHPVEPVKTEGITTTRFIFIPPPPGQRQFYAVTPLTGSASL
jgi:hypothetical protein